ncbi:hypothetical protein HNR65_002242 [Desulfosalsimonas propionicica]|uniref:Helix-turn-helix domain-containing protein n=1 Tax=Desulfosalsimonas propionicica TaxID=332175 RepID=A0A7W0CA03_9BACT|nr:hypothetical protein [Desulfosalsimonas propionicica]MBA2881908.1 hypothetical protein [Desulfosalsimonas propionicica]
MTGVERINTESNRNLSETRELLIAALPPIFGRPKISHYLPGILSGKTVANLESQGEGPPSYQVGRRRFYKRETFVEWFISRMQQERGLK